MPIDNAVNLFTTIPAWAVFIISIWTLVWNGLALWKSARKNHIVWFVVLLIINIFGILDILYLFIFSEMNYKPKTDGGKKTENANKVQKKTKSKTVKKSRS